MHSSFFSGHGARRSAIAGAVLICCHLAAPSAMAEAVIPLSPTALPEGRVVTRGRFGPTSSADGVMRIRQLDGHGVLDWNAFDIGRAAKVTFEQPGRESVVVNRVVGAEASRIEGTLSSNGQVFLLNEWGILVGPEAKIDVGGLVLSTVKAAEEGLMRGDVVIGGLTPTGGAEQVRQYGRIRIHDRGVAVLAGGQVTIGAGIQVPGGRVIVRGQGVEIADSAVLIDVSGEGAMSAGEIDMKSAKTLSIIGQLRAGAEKASGGAIRLAGDDVVLAGSLTTRSLARDGGNVVVTANRGVEQTSAILAGGGRDGGSVRIDAGRGALTIREAPLVVNGLEGAGGSVDLRATSFSMQGGEMLATGATRGGRVTVEASGAPESAVLGIAGRVDLNASATQSGDGGSVTLKSAGAIAAAPRVNLRVNGAGPQGRQGTLELRAGRGSPMGAYLDLGKEAGRGGQLNLGAPAWLLSEVKPDGRSGDGASRSDAAGVSAPVGLMVSELSTWLDRGLSVELAATDRIELAHPLATQAVDSGRLTLRAADIALNADIRRATGGLAATLISRATPGSIAMADDTRVEMPRSTVTFEVPGPASRTDATSTRHGLRLARVSAQALKIESRSAGLSWAVADKTYDGTTRADVEHATLHGVSFTPDSNLRVHVDATFADRRAARDVVATATVSLTGHNGDQRTEVRLHEIEMDLSDTVTRSNREWETVATIRPRLLPVTAVSTPKPYDGTRTALVELAVEPLPQDEVLVAHERAEFDDPRPGVGKTITVSGLTLGGRDGGNYRVEPSTLTLRDGRIDGVVPSEPVPPTAITPPIAPPITPPITPPVTPPVTPPIAPPVTPPIAPPITLPITPLVTPPIAPPIAPPVPERSSITDRSNWACPRSFDVEMREITTCDGRAGRTEPLLLGPDLRLDDGIRLPDARRPI
ncbi:hypothetical protein CDN99_10125 [Roseateles aquatilis]|uniref:Filamentous haemagglutinin FhaB/tRNA nuclease CdiA-like TPS domain-containing protein n=1 Tax=Roseateles aquatilis TaxID=431061 RepID=A0A246JGW5_9BURK|nr:filamentous hemagglutinin N-terminal domain-containing protein [Roseateles aquatilis]OWQ91497.1 hypothetical protein CDN99_10125 [Roseateles aquatilis]